jgi:hypothetical protein
MQLLYPFITFWVKGMPVRPFLGKQINESIAPNQELIKLPCCVLDLPMGFNEVYLDDLVSDIANEPVCLPPVLAVRRPTVTHGMLTLTEAFSHISTVRDKMIFPFRWNCMPQVNNEGHQLSKGHHLHGSRKRS